MYIRKWMCVVMCIDEFICMFACVCGCEFVYTHSHQKIVSALTRVSGYTNCLSTYICRAITRVSAYIICIQIVSALTRTYTCTNAVLEPLHYFGQRTRFEINNICLCIYMNACVLWHLWRIRMRIWICFKCTRLFPRALELLLTITHSLSLSLALSRSLSLALSLSLFLFLSFSLSFSLFFSLSLSLSLSLFLSRSLSLSLSRALSLSLSRTGIRSILIYVNHLRACMNVCCDMYVHIYLHGCVCFECTRLFPRVLEFCLLFDNRFVFQSPTSTHIYIYT